MALVFAIAEPPAQGRPAQLAAIAVPLVLLALSYLFLRTRITWPVLIWSVPPLLGVSAIVALDLATADASAAGQVFLCLPVLYAAAQLRWAGAAIATLGAVLGDGVVTFALLPLHIAVPNFVYVGGTCTTMAVVLVRARSRQEDLVEELQRLAAVDALTGLVTRRVLDQAVTSALAGASQSQGTALVLIDVDHFKRINDTYGHPVGDAALVHLARILTSATRSDSLICRMGGDEIAVLLPGCSQEAALRRARQMLDALNSNPFELADGTLLAISISAGVAQVPANADSLQALYTAADQALYAAKRAGRGQVAASVAPQDSAARSAAS
jgi:diguanylate cyclase (GGDEF)-like protein